MRIDIALHTEGYNLSQDSILITLYSGGHKTAFHQTVEILFFNPAIHFRHQVHVRFCQRFNRILISRLRGIKKALLFPFLLLKRFFIFRLLLDGEKNLPFHRHCRKKGLFRF